MSGRLACGIRKTLAVGLALVFAGCIDGSEEAPLPAASSCGDPPLSFQEPVMITDSGYETVIDIDQEGTIYVSADKGSSPFPQGTRLGSLLWRSEDGGQTFIPLAGGANDSMYGFEGDIAIDGEGRMYFVDVYLADSSVYRYSDHGRTLDFFRPAVATLGQDDRPFLAAHHDGYVYLVVNGGFDRGAEEARPTGLNLDRISVHRSTDGAQTFDPVGFGFPNSVWGNIAADANSDYVYVLVESARPDDRALTSTLENYDTYELASVDAYVSPDRGQSWTRHTIAPYENKTAGLAPNALWPTIAVSPVDGSIYAMWKESPYGAHPPSRLRVARSADHGQTWQVLDDVWPFEGAFLGAWMDVGPTGHIGFTFLGRPHDWETQGDEPQSPIDYYAAILDPRAFDAADTFDPTACDGLTWAKITRTPVHSFSAGVDFTQVRFSPDGRLNFVFADDTAAPPPNVPMFIPTSFKVYFTRQIEGPNLMGGTSVARQFDGPNVPEASP